MDKDELLEIIAQGICVSPLTVERCPVCVDTCDAHHWKREISDTLSENKITRPKEDEPNAG